MTKQLLVLALVAGAMLPARAATIFYGINTSGDLFTLNSATGATTAAGSIALAGNSYFGLAWNGFDLYAYGRTATNAELFKLSIDINTQVATLASTINLGSSTVGASQMAEGDFTFVTSNTGYISSQNATRYDFLSFTFAGLSGSTTNLGNCTASPCADGIGRNLGLDGLYWNGTTLYGTQAQSSTVVTTLDTVNTANGFRTNVGASGLTAGTSLANGALTMNPLSGVYFALNNDSINTAMLYMVNTSTGAFTLPGVSLTGAFTTSISGLAFATIADPAQVVPEPSTLAFGMLGLGALAWRRWRP